MRHAHTCRLFLVAVLAPAATAGLAAEASAEVIYDGTSLPGTGTCPDGTIAWHNDSVLGRVFRIQVHEVTDKNSERCEFAVGRDGLRNGATVWLGWKSRVAAPVTNSWNGIFQAKCHGSHVADQPLVWSIRGGRLSLENHEDIGGEEVSRTVWSTTLPMNRWFSILMRVHYSESRTEGSVQLWYNGAAQTFSNGTTTHRGQTWDGSENNVHWGIYRRSSIDGAQTHYVWRPRIATTRAEADPN